jgi:hypothetical protein
MPSRLIMLSNSRRSVVMGCMLGLLWTGKVLGQNTLQITSPADGTIVGPGQTIAVVVTLGPGSSFPSGIGILGDVPLGGAGPALTPPFSFSLTIPINTSPRRYTITAVGRDASDQLVMSPPIGIQVEKAVAIVKLQVQLTQMTLHSIGHQLPIMVNATFSDGSTADVTGSGNTACASSNSGVATVDVDGVVSAVSRGTAAISVQYGNQLVNIPVSVVTGPAVTVSAAPAILWPPNGQMVPVSISGSVKDTGGGIRPGTGRYQVIDEYGTMQPNGSVPLAVDGSYFFTMLLEASRRGDDQDGRQYSIIVSAKDNAGNPGSASTSVVVPHDQGN